jgi:hypothetical protein
MSTDNDLVARLRIRWDAMGDMANDERAAAATEIERLRDERDEARRRLCAELLEVEGHPVGWKGARGAEGIAERLGWDCFKEGKP